MWGGGGRDGLEIYARRLSKALETCSYEEPGEATGMLTLRWREADGSLAPMENPEARVLQAALESPWDAVLRLHLKVVWLIHRRRLEDAFGVQAQLIQLLVREVLGKAKDENWFLPILYVLCGDLRLLARATDAAQGPHGAEATAANPEGRSFLEQAAGPIMECYRSCVGDIRAAPEVSKRLAILNLTNQLFRIYFRINKLNLLKPLIRAVDNSGALYQHFSMADQVTYKYYLGRKAMFDADLGTAEEALGFAFRQTRLLGHPRNERLILTYLVPVKMFLGHMPQEDLLRRHKLHQRACWATRATSASSSPTSSPSRCSSATCPRRTSSGATSSTSQSHPLPEASLPFRQTRLLGHPRNERLILTYLVPVKMFLGHMPQEDLLRRHKLHQFLPVAEAVKAGNVGRLDAALEEHQGFFIQSGIFLMLEKLKIITYRNLFKTVAAVSPSHQIDLALFVAALKFAASEEEKEEVDEAEVACILANLIYEGKVKGYISHQHKKLVVSKQLPFPPLSASQA